MPLCQQEPAVACMFRQPPPGLHIPLLRAWSGCASIAHATRPESWVPGKVALSQAPRKRPSRQVGDVSRFLTGSRLPRPNRQNSAELSERKRPLTPWWGSPDGCGSPDVVLLTAGQFLYVAVRRSCPLHVCRLVSFLESEHRSCSSRFGQHTRPHVGAHLLGLL